jgi:hypothetical protein
MRERDAETRYVSVIPRRVCANIRVVCGAFNTRA